MWIEAVDMVREYTQLTCEGFRIAFLDSLRVKAASLCDMIEFSISGQDLLQGISPSDGSGMGSGHC